MFNQPVNQSIIQTVTQTVNQSLCYCWSQTPFEMAWKLAHFLCCWLLLVVKKWSYGDIYVDGKIGYVELAMKEFQLAEQLNRMPLNNAFLGKTFCSVNYSHFLLLEKVSPNDSRGHRNLKLIHYKFYVTDFGSSVVTRQLSSHYFFFQTVKWNWPIHKPIQRMSGINNNQWPVNKTEESASLSVSLVYIQKSIKFVFQPVRCTNLW